MGLNLVTLPGLALFASVVRNGSLSRAALELVAEQVDVAIRIGHLPDSTLVARKLGELHWQLAASPHYLAQHGTPRTPAELALHDCLVYRNGPRAMNNWAFDGPDGPQSVMV